MRLHECGFFTAAKNSSTDDTTPFGLSLKEPMFSSPTPQGVNWTRGIEPSPTATPHGGDGGVDVYID